MRMRAQRLRNRQDYAGAAQSYHLAMDLDGANPFDLSMIAQCLEGVDDQAALEAAERALSLAPKTFLALQTAACIQSRRGLYEVAAGYAERSLAVMPKESSFRGPCFVIRLLALIPILGHRVNREELARCQHPDGYMHSWRKWSSDYLKWYRAQVRDGSGESV